jgi:single-strand DNA-binding protein
MNLNKVILMGRLGKNVETKVTPSGVTVANFSLATSESVKQKDGSRQEKTDWHNVVVFGKVGENCSKFLSKGSAVYVEGRISYRMWEKDGRKFYATDIIANNIQFLDKKEAPVDAALKKVQQQAQQDNQQLFTTDDIPF